MQVRSIHFNEDFRRQFQNLPELIQKKAVNTERYFRNNAFHPSLRLHKLEGKLRGLWSISVDLKYRIIFKPLDDGVILFVSIGLHAIYNKH